MSIHALMPNLFISFDDKEFYIDTYGIKGCAPLNILSSVFPFFVSDKE